MHNPSYLQLDYPCFVYERSSTLEPEYAGKEPSGWADDEISEIRTVLQKLTSIRILNPTDAEDLVQDTLLTMLTKYPGSELEKGLLVWSMGILRKKVGNYYRKIQRYTPFGDQEPRSQQSIRECMMTASPEATLFHDELQGIINETLRQLPSAQREAIELLISGLDSGEVVRQLHPEPYQNVINRIYRGRKTLAKELAKYGYGPGARSGLRKMKKCRLRK